MSGLCSDGAVWHAVCLGCDPVAFLTSNRDNKTKIMSETTNTATSANTTPCACACEPKAQPAAAPATQPQSQPAAAPVPAAPKAGKRNARKR
jgi:hypothetical protein